MKWLRIGAGGQSEEVDGEQLNREWREAERAAGPKEGSRDWKPCPKCKTTGLRAWGGATPPSREFWECPTCHMSISFVREIPLEGELTPFEWSLVRHMGCGAWGHRACLPDVWLDEIRLEGARLVSCLGELELARVRR